MRFVRVILGFIYLCLRGCASKQPQRDWEPNAGSTQSIEDTFLQALRDFKQSGELTPVQSSGMDWQVLLLPTSVEPLIHQKHSALPILERLKASIAQKDAVFADACMAAMTAKHVQRGKPFTSKGTGIEMVAYTISN